MFVKLDELTFACGRPRLHRPVQSLASIAGHLSDAAFLVVLPSASLPGGIELCGTLDPREAQAVADLLQPPT